MIPINLSHTKTSSIVHMSERLVKAMNDSGQEYLMLNRGVNAVEPINLVPVTSQINFNSNDIQVYPATKGKMELRNAINTEYFGGHSNPDHLLITGGGIAGLDITFQNLNITEVLLPRFFWGTYAQLLNLRKIPFSTYANYQLLNQMAGKLKGKAVIICDPGNPLGEKYDDTLLLQLIGNLNQAGAVILFDSPYRRVFFDNTDDLYQQLLKFNQVIIIESFSKSLGLSGQRIGFIHSTDADFIKEATLRILYATNGINGFAQTLVTKLLTTSEGQQVVRDFKLATTDAIAKNIAYLEQHHLLADQYYHETRPIGIFAVINQSTDLLFKHRIGAVSLGYFSTESNHESEEVSRISVSVPHQKFAAFFNSII